VVLFLGWRVYGFISLLKHLILKFIFFCKIAVKGGCENLLRLVALLGVFSV